MLGLDFFWSILWIVMICIIWFRTDWFIHYSQLFEVNKKLRLQFMEFIKINPDLYFPDFLFTLSLTTSNKFLRFILKLISCPLCLIVWLSIVAAIMLNNIVLIAPLYVLSLSIFLLITKLI